MDNKMNDFVNKMGAAKGMSLGMKLVAGVGLAAYGVANSMFTSNYITIYNACPFLQRFRPKVLADVTVQRVFLV